MKTNCLMERGIVAKDSLQERDQWSVLCALIRALRENESWAGQTHIQKAVYLLKNLTDVPLDFGFRLYRYGPYSFDLRDEVSFLTERKVLKATPHEPYGLRFSVGEECVTGAEQKFARQIEFVGKTVGKRNIGELEALSTALLVTLDSPESNSEERLAKLKVLKPRISDSLAKDAIEEIDALNSEAQSLALS
jgi:uncharacterized protein YwgA